MPRDFELQRSEPRLCTHVAFGSWILAALGQRGVSPARFLQFARAQAGLSAEATHELTRPESTGYLQAKDCFALWEAAFEIDEREATGKAQLLAAILREV